jgi:hypothetical protein
MKNSEAIIKTLRKTDKSLKGSQIASLSGLDKILMDKSIKELDRQRKIFSAKSRHREIKK